MILVEHCTGIAEVILTNTHYFNSHYQSSFIEQTSSREKKSKIKIMKKWMHVLTLYQIWYLYLYIVVGINQLLSIASLRNRTGKTLVRDKRDRAITCVFCRDLHLTSMFFGLYKKICLKESEVCRKVILNKIIVLLVTQGLLSVFPLPSCRLFSSIKSLITLELTRPQSSSRNVCGRSRGWCILHSRF